jgi:glycerol-3-phosphate dehydrogenase
LAMIDQDEAQRLLPQVQVLLEEAGMASPNTPRELNLSC